MRTATKLAALAVLAVVLMGCPAAPTGITAAQATLRLQAIEHLDERYQAVRVPARQACDAEEVTAETCAALRKAGLAYDRAYSEAVAAAVTTEYEAAMIELGVKLALVEGAWKLAQEEIE